MKIAITGGTGFVGGHLARALCEAGHDVVLIARGCDSRDGTISSLPRSRFQAADLSDPDVLRAAFAGCQGVAHCAGINREQGRQSYHRVHVEATRNVVEACRTAGAARVVLLSFLRARPSCGSPYHESKWAAEEIVRSSGLDYTIVKSGVIYGRGDHMLDHLSRGLNTFPVFPLVGFREQRIRPLAVEDLVRILMACLIDGELARRTISVTGPEEIPLAEAVRRVALVVGRRPLIVPAPVIAHQVLGWILEKVMTIPLVSLAQVRILSEGIAEPLPGSHPLPEHLRPRLTFSQDQVRLGLPDKRGFGWKDLRWFA